MQASKYRTSNAFESACVVSFSQPTDSSCDEKGVYEWFVIELRDRNPGWRKGVSNCTSTDADIELRAGDDGADEDAALVGDIWARKYCSSICNTKDSEHVVLKLMLVEPVMRLAIMEIGGGGQ